MPGKKKIVRLSTIPLSMNIFCRGLLTELAMRYEVVAVTSPGEGYEQIALREGVRAAAVSMKRNIAPLHDIIALWKLFRLFRVERPQLVHSITPKAGLLSMVAARLAGVPVRVHTFTGLLFPTAKGVKKRLLQLTDKLTCVCATDVHAEGEGVRKDLLDAKITKKSIRILGYGSLRGIDLNLYDRTPDVLAQAATIRTSLNVSPQAIVFLFVGRLVPDKGIAELVDAFCRLQALHPETHLLLVGGEETQGPAIANETRKEMARNTGIHLIPWQDDVRAWYAASDIFVFPSHREGFPNAVIEAGAMGLPAIVTDINGSREIITTGENGIILPVANTEALQRAMQELTENAAMRNQMAGKTRSLVALRYDQGYVRGCLKSYYEEVLP